MQRFTIHSLHDEFDKSVEVGPEVTLLELRYQIFSLTDIPPDRILLHFEGNTIHPNDDLDENTTLSSLGITSTTNVAYSDFENPINPAPAPQPQSWKHPKQVITIDDVKAALQQYTTQSQSRGGASSSAYCRATDEFLSKVRTYHDAIVTYEDKDLQEKALKEVPLESLQNQARERYSTDAKYPTYEHAFIRELLHWFKTSFFTWIETPTCWSCGEKTNLDDILQPSETEDNYQASRTELFSCPECGAETRFPRYNDVAKLLETRRGRCGEWVQAFTLIARATGLHVRSVHDWTDHVWTEIWCGRWVHVDCCEDMLDKPLLYEEGWKKKLNYCIATGVDCVIDVTRGYTKNFDALRERRTLADEELLQAGLQQLNSQALWRLESAERVAAVKRYEEEMIALAKGPEDTKEELPGRQSGSAEWVQLRGEDGSGE